MHLITLKLWIANWLDILQRYLIKDRFNNFSRSELIKQLIELENCYKSVTSDLNPQIIHLVDDVEAIARGDLSVRTERSDWNSLEFSITFAVHDPLNVFLDELCELIADLPEESPLRRKYRLPERFY